MGASAVDAEAVDEENFMISGLDANTCLQALAQIARSTDNAESLRLLLSSIYIRQEEQRAQNSKSNDKFYSTTKKRHSNETSEELRAREKGVETKRARKTDAKCAQGNRLVQVPAYECDDCERLFSTEAALKTHKNSCSEAASAPKSPKYDCTLCDKKRTNIYHHYASVHHIEYPEQILFNNGNVLVRSDIDTEHGKAPWFLQEKEKAANNNDNLTCRLCEAKPRFDNPAILADHYTLNHSVHPAMLVNLEQLFRAEKGAHLLGKPTSQTPSQGKQRAPSAHETTNSKNEKENTRWLCKVCNGTYSNIGNWKRHVKIAHPEKKPEEVTPIKVLPNAPNNRKHTPNTENKGLSKSMKYECALCDKKITSIYKHYGNIHNIDYPEQILFVNGNVLVLSDIHTGHGKAPWFLREVKNVEKYTPTTCRLCETVYRHPAILEEHYRSDHRVIPSALKCLQHLFRAQKGAHLVDQPASRTAKPRVASFPPEGDLSSRSIKKMGCKVSTADNRTQKPGQDTEKRDTSGLIMYQCKECEVATPTYDASVEHAQLHHLEGYRPRKETCVTCNFDFEAECYAEHLIAHNDTNEYQILWYDPSKLLNDEWFDIFQGLSENHANLIKFSSNYHHTRRVKMNSDIGSSGIPLYQCDLCKFYVHPKDVEDHCNIDNTCVKEKSPNLHCPECDIFFYTLEAAREHYDKHTGLTDGFRKVTFNCKQDSTINKALKNIHHDSLPVENTSVRTTQKKKPTVEILQNDIVSVFCDECKCSILYSNFDAHAATHNNKRVEEESSLNKDHENLGDTLSQGLETGDFRKLTSNCKEDSTINKALKNIHHDSLTVENASVRTQQKNNRTAEILQNDVVSVFCDECKCSIMYYNFDAHAATHNNKCVEKQSSLNKEHENLGDNLSQNEPMETIDGNGGGTVEPWNSDNDSCHSLRISSVQVQVQVEKEAKELHSNQDKLDNRNNKWGNTNKAVTDDTCETDKNSKPNASLTHQDKDIQETEGQEEWDVFSKELKDALKRDLQNLGLKEITQEHDYHNSEHTTTQELLEILASNSEERGNSVINNKTNQKRADDDGIMVQNENNTEANISQDIFSSDPSQIHRENSEVTEISQDIFNEETQNPEYDIIDNSTNNDIENTKTDRENAPNPTVAEGDDMQSIPRPSIRDILTRLLESVPSDHNAAAEEERRNEKERKMKQQSLIEDTQRIRELMSSRD